MKKMTIASTVLAVGMCLGSQSGMAAGSLDDQELVFAFGSEKSSMMLLSEQEMVETEGEFAWFLVPLVLSVGAYVADSYINDYETSASGYAWAAASAVPAVRGAYAATQLTSNTAKTFYGVTGGAVTYGLNRANPFAGNGGSNYQNNSNNFGRDVSSYCGMC